MKKVSMALLVMVFMVIFTGCTKKAETENVEQPTSELGKFAQCLTDKGIKMYGTEWCSHCKNQKSKFENDFKFVDYTDCDKKKSVCKEAGISGYPTWVIDGKKYSGSQSLSKLSETTGCSLSL